MRPKTIRHDVSRNRNAIANVHTTAHQAVLRPNTELLTVPMLIGDHGDPGVNVMLHVVLGQKREQGNVKSIVQTRNVQDLLIK